MRQVKAGTADISVVVRIIDSTNGTPELAVTAATAGLVLEYRRELEAEVSLAPITDLAALTTAHTDKGMLHIGDGYYRVDLPDAACAAGQVGVLVHGVATGMVVIGEYIELPANVEADTFGRLGAPAGASVSADIAAAKGDTAAILVDTGTTLDGRIPAALVGGRMDSSVGAVAANAITAAGIAADAITDAKVAADVTIASVTGAVGSVTGNVGGSVASIATGGIATTSFAAGAIDAAAIAANAIGASELAADAVDEILDEPLLDSVPADGALPTLRQAIYMITQFLMERSVVTTTVTVKKVDGSTALMTFTLNDGTSPTSITRAT